MGNLLSFDCEKHRARSVESKSAINEWRAFKFKLKFVIKYQTADKAAAKSGFSWFSTLQLVCSESTLNSITRKATLAESVDVLIFAIN